MKITKEIIEGLGAEQSGREVGGRVSWTLHSGGYEFFFHRITSGPDVGWFFGLDHRWSHCHSVTHLEECFGFAMQDGVVAGKNQLRQEVRELLEDE